MLTVVAQHPRGAVGRSLNVAREKLLLLVVAVWLRVVRLLSSALSILALRVFFFEYTNDLVREMESPGTKLITRMPIFDRASTLIYYMRRLC